MADWRRFERLHRSRFLATPFVLTNALTRFEIHGKEHLLRALKRRDEEGRGIITISNHQSLFDDPMVHMALLGVGNNFTVEKKIWWSTPCQSNFNPTGKDFTSKFTRYFSEVSNMVFFERPAKKGGVLELPHSYMEALNQRGDAALLDRLMERASRLGVGGESLLRSFVTEGNPIKLAPMNQTGMIEACARANLGDWLHFFPEGGRSRNASLRPAKRGVGKVIYHSPDAQVIPFAFCGMHDVLPIKSLRPRAGKKVVVMIGEPVRQSTLEALRTNGASPETFAALTATAWASVKDMYPTVREMQGTPVPAEEELNRGKIVVEHAARQAAGQTASSDVVMGSEWAMSKTPARRTARM